MCKMYCEGQTSKRPTSVQSGYDAFVFFVGLAIVCMCFSCVPCHDSHPPLSGAVHRQQANILAALGISELGVKFLDSNIDDVPGYYAPHGLFPHLSATTVSLLANGAYQESFHSDIPVPSDVAQQTGKWDVTNSLIRLVPSVTHRSRETQTHYYMWIRCLATHTDTVSENIAGDWLIPFEKNGSMQGDILKTKDVDESRMIFIQRTLCKQSSKVTNLK